MKMIFNNKKIRIAVLFGWLFFLAGCNKKLDGLTPHNVNFEDQQFSSPSGFTKATIGNYFALQGMESVWFNISEFRGNNVKIIDQVSNTRSMELQVTDAFKYINSDSKDFGLSHQFWQNSYQALLAVNMVLKNVKEGEADPVILQAKAENLFLRAFINFNLVRVYGRPYYQSPASNLGVPIILQPIIEVTSNPPPRATVKEVYDQIIADLMEAAPLFNQDKGNSFASKYAAYAFLSRVYLYMSGTFDSPADEYAKLVVKYADSVIMNGGYSLLYGNDFTEYYNSGNEGNSETIWAMNHDMSFSNLPEILNQPVGPLSSLYSTGQAKPSKDLLDMLEPDDLRWNFFQVDKYRSNVVDTLSTWKYYYRFLENGVLFSNAPFHHFRLAEVYLNRAEAKVKLGDDDNALSDLNVIHTRAGLTPLSGLSGQDLFDAVMAERRMELAFEGHIGYDYFRNGLPMVRNYSSFNSPAITINPADPRVVLRIPRNVLIENRNIRQNDQ